MGGSGGSAGPSGRHNLTLVDDDTGREYVIELGGPKPAARTAPLIWGGVEIPGYALWGQWVGVSRPWGIEGVAPPYSGRTISERNFAPPYKGDTPYHAPYLHTGYDVELVEGIYEWDDYVDSGTNLWDVFLSEMRARYAETDYSGPEFGYSEQKLYFTTKETPSIRITLIVRYLYYGGPYTWDASTKRWPEEVLDDMAFIGEFQSQISMKNVLNTNTARYGVDTSVSHTGYKPGGGFAADGYTVPSIYLGYDEQASSRRYKVMSNTKSYGFKSGGPTGPSTTYGNFCPYIKALSAEYDKLEPTPGGGGSRVQYRMPGWATSR